jgi:hypothetical protein
VHDSWLATTNACRRCAGTLLFARTKVGHMSTLTFLPCPALP